MNVIMEIEEVKEAIKVMEKERKECFVTNTKLSEEALNWLRSQKYLVKIVGGLTAIAKTEAVLPTEEELEEMEKEVERKMCEMKAIDLRSLLIASVIMRELFS